ncbi:MAG: alpha/beta hydrolase [Verrucomicrobiota bacterium JB022]|nr:alpha/beta hydrolase [Verrucomicrobiota bacterium JB022]
MNAIQYQTKQVDDVEVFYREAGDRNTPTLLLLHGFPTSSHMYRQVIPLLAEHFHVVAPDLPGFGYTKAPPRGQFAYTFDNLYRTLHRFTEALQLQRYALYVFDYGAPVGFRLAAAAPEKITAIISQNGNAYEEGLLGAWDPIRAYWEQPTQANRDALRAFLTAEATAKYQYFYGVPEHLKSRISPDALAHDQAILDRNPEIQLDLFGDYQTNVALYPEWQAYFRQHQPPLLAVWGQNDVFFGPDGARGYQRDIPAASINFFDTGHFALETHSAEIADKMIEFLQQHLR